MSSRRDQNLGSHRHGPTVSLPRLVALALIGALAGTSLVALGQERERPRSGTRPEAEAPRSGAEADEAPESTDAESEERVEGDGKVKVFEFSGLDISGRLKSPQLLYFLNRLRAEFDRPRLPHRSFMPELVRSSKGKAF